jgi:hypothetical protein
VNTIGDPHTNPDVANAAADVSEQRLIELVRIGAGVADLPVKITGLARWRSTSDVARQYQVGRVFLAGDAAHVMPPNGGFGGNTGIHDAHNLAWKLAAVLGGVAAPSLLDSYEAERRPVGTFTVEQAYTRYVTRTATYLGATDFQPLAPDFNIEIGYLYHSEAVHGDPLENGARAGARAPHVWLQRNGQRLSTLDLFGRGFVVLTPADDRLWLDACSAAIGKYTGLVLECHRIGTDVQQEPSAGPSFAEVYGLSPTGAVLVRPDGFVAWRTRSIPENAASALAQVLGQLLNSAVHRSA